MQNVRLGLVAVVLFIAGFLIWQHLQSIDADFEENSQLASRVRHDYVISQDFVFLKERLVELHGDYWQEKKQMQAKAKQKMWMLSVFMLAVVGLSVIELREIRKKRRKQLN